MFSSLRAKTLAKILASTCKREPGLWEAHSIGSLPCFAISVIHASLNDDGSLPCLSKSDNTELTRGASNEENNFKNSAEKPSGPGDFPDCNEEMVAPTFSCDTG